MADLQAQLSALLDEVDRCGSVRLQFEASETLRDQASKMLEQSRVHLVSFSMADQNELRSIVKQFSDEVKHRARCAVDQQCLRGRHSQGCGASRRVGVHK